MYTIVFASLVVLASSLPTQLDEFIPILHDDRIYPESDGFSTNIETGNGIHVFESGAPGVKGQINIQGVYKYPLEDGTFVEVKYVADEFGFKPDSSVLPVAPAFPHPIPQHALDQIAYGEELRRQRAQQNLNE